MKGEFEIQSQKVTNIQELAKLLWIVT